MKLLGGTSLRRFTAHNNLILTLSSLLSNQSHHNKREGLCQQDGMVKKMEKMVCLLHQVKTKRIEL